MNKPLRIIFMGTPEFALKPLEALYHAGHKIVAVYCQPPKEKGRGYKVQENPTHLWANEHNIPVFTPKSLRSFEELETFKSFNADIAVVVAYGMILPKEILDIPPMGCVNIHGSLLPRWRGAAPIQRSIMEGDTVTGITTMFMDEGLDTGPMLEWESIEINDETTSSSLYEDLSILGAKLILSTLEGLYLKTLKATIQPLEGITYAHKLLKSEGELDFTLPSRKLDCMIRGLVPQISIWAEFKSKRLKIIEVLPVAKTFDVSPGIVIHVNDKLFITCGEGSLEIISLQPEGGKHMSVDAFLRGFIK
jgi:methionyl-tRNA formyltransferase